MNRGAFIIVIAALLAAARARADGGPSYLLQDGSIDVVVDNALQNRVKVECREPKVAIVLPPDLHVSCGAEGELVYSLADPLHPTLSGRIGAPSQPATTPVDPSTVLVHIDGAYAELIRKPKHEIVCTTPCDVRVPRKSFYYVDDMHKTKSHPFTLARSADRARLEVTRQNVSRADVGATVLVGGLALGGAYVGVGVALSSDTTSCNGLFCIPASAFSPFFYVLGGAVALTGICVGTFLVTTSWTRLAVRVSATPGGLRLVF